MKCISVLVSIFILVSSAQAEETLAEKAEATAKNVIREMKKGVNRAEEAACGKLTGDSKAACLAKKAKNRVSETADVVTDKASEIKNSAD